jgi:Txe/YoeB family toxin of toxin-antitoxin system
MRGGSGAVNEPWQIVYTREALKDKRIAYEAGFKEKIEKLLTIIRKEPYQTYPPYKKLIGDLSGAYSRQINHQHRLVYAVYQKEKTIKIISIWNHMNKTDPKKDC